jgi:serine/threonine protein kinase
LSVDAQARPEAPSPDNTFDDANRNVGGMPKSTIDSIAEAPPDGTGVWVPSPAQVESMKRVPEQSQSDATFTGEPSVSPAPSDDAAFTGEPSVSPAPSDDATFTGEPSVSPAPSDDATFTDEPAVFRAPSSDEATLANEASLSSLPSDDATISNDNRAPAAPSEATIASVVEVPSEDRTGAWQPRSAARKREVDEAAPTVRTSARDGARKTAKAEGSRIKVPGYEILGELGRGGMGVVYKARQVGLNRLVALKMVLAGAHASAEQLARFKIEAEAVAHLQHPNIVGVFEIGQHDGCPFFSLEYIDGPSLEKQIDSTPQRPQDAARMVQMLAQAMQAAHERGIIHRDLKPANILLAQGGSGAETGEMAATTHHSPLSSHQVRRPLSAYTPKITDFGLAKRFDDKDEGHTRTGAIMGTPSYMAPEQAQGRTKETGPPADIYSLGAILYDLLTGRPPFRGATLLDTLQQVQAVEPVSPVRLQPNIARDLETICLKALEKNPQKRYHAAGLLAEDLRRFLAGEPILARPTPWWERSVKWARRRPALASLIGVSILAVVSLLTFGALWLDSERRGAEDREIAANERERVQTEQAKKEKTLRERAETNFLRAKDAVDLMLSRVGQDTLAHVPQMTAIRRELLEKAVDFYEQFRKEASTDPAIRWEAGRAQQRVADIYQKLGRPDRAAKTYEQALVSLSGLAKDYPHTTQYRQSLAGGYNNFGNLLKDTKQSQKAEKYYRQAMDLRAELMEAAPQVPEHSQELAESLNNLGVALQTLGRLKEAGPAYGRGAELLRKLSAQFPNTPRFREELARNLDNQGSLFQQMGRTAPAEKSFAEARTLWSALVQYDAGNPEYRRQLALTFNHLGDLWRDTRGKDAEKTYHKALELQQKLAKDFSTVPSYAEEWAASYGSLAILLGSLGREQEADRAQDQALGIRRKIVADYPKLPEFTINLAASLNVRALALYRHSKLKDAEDAFQESLEIFARLNRQYKDVPRYEQELAGAYLNLGLLYSATGRGRAGEESIDKALKFYQELARRFADIPQHQQDLGQAYMNRGVLLQARQQPQEVEKAYARAAEIFAALAEKSPENPDFRYELAAARNNQGNALRALNRPKEAEKAWQSARQLLVKLSQDQPGVPVYRRELAQNLNEIGVHLVQSKQVTEAEKTWQEARRLRQQLADEFPEQVDYRLDLAKSLRNLGIILAHMSELKKSEASFRQGIALLEEWEPKLPVTPIFSQELINLYRNLAELHSGLNRPAEVEKSLMRILSLKEKLVKAFPKAAEFCYDLASSLNEIAGQLMQRDRFDDARKHLESAAGHLNAILKVNDKDAHAHQSLYVTYLNLATAHQNLSDHRRAAKTVADAAAHVPMEQPMFERFAAILAGCSVLAKKDGKLSAEDAKKLPPAYAGHAMELLTKAVHTGFKDAKFLQSEAFEGLQQRSDFRRLIAEITSDKAQAPNKNPKKK